MATNGNGMKTKVQMAVDVLRGLGSEATYQQVRSHLKEDGVDISDPVICQARKRLGFDKLLPTKIDKGRPVGILPDDEDDDEDNEVDDGHDPHTPVVPTTPTAPIPAPAILTPTPVRRVVTGSNMVDLDHFAAALKAAEVVGSWRELARLATIVADKLEVE